MLRELENHNELPERDLDSNPKGLRHKMGKGGGEVGEREKPGGTYEALLGEEKTVFYRSQNLNPLHEAQHGKSQMLRDIEAHNQSPEAEDGLGLAMARE